MRDDQRDGQDFDAAEARHLLHAGETVRYQKGDAKDSRETMSGKLHADILEELPLDFIRLMLNWASTVDGGPVSTSSALWGMVGGGTYESKLPVLLGEADDTHKAVLTLPQRYQEVITIFWTRNGMRLEDMARATPRVRLWKLGKASFRDWLDTGHERLQTVLMAQRKHERERAKASAAAQVQ